MFGNCNGSIVFHCVFFTFLQLVWQCPIECLCHTPNLRTLCCIFLHLSRQVSQCQHDLHFDIAFRESPHCMIHPNPAWETDFSSLMPNSSSASISPPLFFSRFSFLFLLQHDLEFVCWCVMAARKGRKTNIIEQTDKVVPLITGEVIFGHHVSKLVFGVNMFDLDFGSKFIMWNNQQGRLCTFRTSAPSDQHFAKIGASDTCRQQWTFVSELLRDAPCGDASLISAWGIATPQPHKMETRAVQLAQSKDSSAAFSRGVPVGFRDHGACSGCRRQASGIHSNLTWMTKPSFLLSSRPFLTRPSRPSRSTILALVW